MKALIELKKECFNRIAGCFCCCCYNKNPKQLVIHHLGYTEKSVTYNKFENSDDGRLQYYSKLLDEIKQDGSNFVVLCFECHQVIEKLLKMSWIDAYNYTQNNNGEYNMYYDVWDKSYKKRENNLHEGLDDSLIMDEPKCTELADFFK